MQNQIAMTNAEPQISEEQQKSLVQVLKNSAVQTNVNFINTNRNLEINQNLHMYLLKVNQDMDVYQNLLSNQQNDNESILKQEEVAKIKKDTQQQKNMKEISNLFHLIKG